MLVSWMRSLVNLQDIAQGGAMTLPSIVVVGLSFLEDEVLILPKIFGFGFHCSYTTIPLKQYIPKNRFHGNIVQVRLIYVTEKIMQCVCSFDFKLVLLIWMFPNNVGLVNWVLFFDGYLG